MGCPEVFGKCPEVFGCIKTVHLGQTGLYANPRFYCDGKLIAKAIDLKPYIEARRARLDRKKNH